MIDVNKIQLTLPDGVVTSGELSLSGNIATVTLLSSSVGNKTISAQYDDSEPVSTILHVTEETLFTGLTSIPETKVFTGETVKIIASFSKVPTLADLVITPPLGFLQKGELIVDGLSIIGEFTAPILPSQNNVFTANFRNNTTIKSVELTVVDKPANMLKMTSNLESIRISETVTITAEFDKQPKLEEFNITVDDGLELSESSKIVDNSIVTTYTARTTGIKNIKATYGEQEETVTINVLEDSYVLSVVGEPEPVSLGGTVSITVTYDKARLDGQPEMEVQLDAGLAEKTPYSENPEKTGGVMQVIGSEPGDKTVTFILGGKTKILKITVNPN